MAEVSRRIRIDHAKPSDAQHTFKVGLLVTRSFSKELTAPSKRNSRNATPQSDIATWSSLLYLHSLNTVVNDILQHTFDLLDAGGFQELLPTQLISITQYNIRKNLSYLLEVNIFLLHVIENIRDSLQRQKVADIL